jgi:hypothetical protein
MNRTPVTSSNLASVGYDPAQQTLEIEFQTGSVYQYYDVPQEIYDALMAAESHGQYFTSQIRSNYLYRQIKQ